MLDKFVTFVKNFKSQIDGLSPTLIISGLPPIPQGEINLKPDDKYFGAPNKCQMLQTLYKEYCENNKIIYIDNSNLEVGIDCLHLTENSHKILAEKISKTIKAL